MQAKEAGYTSCSDDDLPLWTFEKNEFGGHGINHAVLS